MRTKTNETHPLVPVVAVAVVGPWLRLLLVAAALELNWDDPLISFWRIGKNPDLA